MNAHEAVVAALSEHVLVWGEARPGSIDANCTCGVLAVRRRGTSVDKWYASHLAAVLAPLIEAERAAALREAADDCRELGGGTWDWTVLASRADSISTTTHDNEGDES